MLLLVYNRADGKYRIGGDVAGAFPVIDNRVNPVVERRNYEKFPEMAVSNFESEVRQRVR